MHVVHWLRSEMSEILGLGGGYGLLDCNAMWPYRKYQRLGQRFSNCGAPPSLGEALIVLRGPRVVCMRNIFIFNEIWAKDKIYILLGTLLGSNILCIT
jgi:hypothetical protein